MYRKILVPLDGTPFAEHALPLALALARRSRAGIHLVTVASPLVEAYLEGLYVGTEDLEAEVTARRQGYLDTTKARLQERIDVPITTEVMYGEVSTALCELAESGHYDLVVMATHGRSPLSRFWLGSVADEMLRHATLPLLLVRPGDEEPKLTEEPDLGRIVLPLDGTELAERIVEPAATIASLMPGSELVLVRAIRPVTLFDASPAMAESGVEAAHLVMEAEAMQAKSQHDAETYLAGVAHRLEARGLKVTTHVVVEDKPAEAILHEAEGERAKLIAMETHGRSGLARLFLGSVADKVLHSAHVPILVQRPVNA